MIPCAILLLAAAMAQPTAACTTLPSQEQADARLSELFDYDRPQQSEAALRDLASAALSCGNAELAAASLAQAARAQAMQGKLTEAQATLARAAALASAPRTLIKIQLEQGRIARRERKIEQARDLLDEAFDKAKLAGQDALAADAAHMLALLEPSPAYLEWTKRGLAIAEGSRDAVARRWIGNLAYNAGVRLSESGNHESAALMFARSLAARRIENDAELVAAAELALSAELAQMGRFEEAEAIQQRLLAEASSNPEFAAEIKALLSQTAKLRDSK